MGLKLVLAAIVSSALSSCGPKEVSTDSSGATGPKGTRTVSFMVFGDPAELHAYQDLVSAFEKRHPEIKVELVHIPSQSDYRKRTGTDFAGGSPTDVLLINYRRFAEFAKKGVLKPLGSYLAKSTVIKESDFYPQAIEPFKWNGELMGIPQNLSSLVVYYNKDMFDKAKLPYPKAGWTWEEFVTTAKALTKDVDGDGRIDQHGLGTEVSLQRLAPFIWQNGGQLVDSAGDPKALSFGTPEAKEAFQWFADLQLKHKVVPNQVEEKSEDSESRFQSGRIAMLLNSRRGVPTYREIKSFDWDVVSLPTRKNASGILHADGYFMPKSVKNKADAWTFIEFANSVEGQTIVAKSGRTVPSLMEVARSDAFLNPTQRPANSKVFLDTLADLRTVPVHPAWAEIETTATDEIERAFYGTAPVDVAFNTMIERTREMLTD